MIIRKLEAIFTLNTNAVQFKEAASELDNLASKAEKVMNAIAGYWAVQALQNLITNTVNAMAEVGKTAEYLGITSDALQELRYAAEKSGVAVDTLDDSLKELMIRSVDAKSGTGEAAEAFAALGHLKPTDAVGRMREPLELLDEIADRLNNLPTPSDRMWVVDSMFGDQGAQMLKMLKGGSKGLRDMRLEARSLGHLLGTEAIANAERFTKALKRLRTASKATGQSFVQDFLKSLSWMMERFASLNVAINKTHVSASTFRLAWISLSAVLAAVAAKAAIAFAPLLVQAAPVIGTVALIGGGLIGLVAIAEDLWVAFQGGNSVFLALWEKSNAFFAPVEQWLAKLPEIVRSCMAEVFNATSKGFAEAWQSASKEFAKFSAWIIGELNLLAQKAKDLVAGLIPDFLKKGFSATFNSVNAHSDPADFQSRIAPPFSSVSHQNRMTSNQNVSVAVHVKSGADPQIIGGEVSKAIRLELERERLNAFMGVTQYAG